MVPNGWVVKNLDSIYRVIDSLHQTPSFSKDGEYRMVRVTDIKGKNLDLSNAVRVSKEVFLEYTKKYKPKRNDILFSRVGSYGISSFVDTDQEFCLGQNTVIAESNDQANPIYIFNVLKSEGIRQQVEKTVDGSSHKTVSLKVIKYLKIPLAPRKEQNKIAQILSTWDQAISATEKLLENSQQQKKALMQQLLTGKKRLLDENGVEFSGEWKFLTFDELFIVANKKSAQVKSSDYLLSGSIPIVDQSQKIIAGYCDSKEVYSDTPVIVFGDHTRCIKWVDFSFCPGADGTQVLDVKKGVDKKLAYYVLLNTPIPNLGYSRHMRELKEKDFKIPLDLKEQIKISKFLSLVDQEIETLQKKLDCLQQEKKALMQQLLTGKKRVKVAA